MHHSVHDSITLYGFLQTVEIEKPQEKKAKDF